MKKRKTSKSVAKATTGKTASALAQKLKAAAPTSQGSLVQSMSQATRAISEALWLAETADEGKKDRQEAMLLVRAMFQKCSWGMRRLARIDSEALADLIAQTHLNCAAFRNGEQIHRNKVRKIAHWMSEFPVLQSAGSRLRQSSLDFLSDIQLGARVCGSRGSTRLTDNLFASVARNVISHLQALLIVVPTLLDSKDRTIRLYPMHLKPAMQNALSLFGRLGYRISDIPLQDWPALWNVVKTLIITPCPPSDLDGVARDWAIFSWRDLYDNDELRKAITADTHRVSEATIESHIRDKIKVKIEGELGITKRRKQSKRSSLGKSLKSEARGHGL